MPSRFRMPGEARNEPLAQKQPHLRKGDRTRARLIAATIQVLGREGYKDASVLAITRAAKVSNGTFYLYFRNKAEIIEAAVFFRAAEITRAINDHEHAIADIARRCAYAIRAFVSAILADPPWARAMLATWVAAPEHEAWGGISRFMMRTLAEGIEQGVFDIEGSPLETECTKALLMTTVRMSLEGAAGENAVHSCIVLVLKMLGVNGAQAAAAASWSEQVQLEGAGEN